MKWLYLILDQHATTPVSCLAFGICILSVLPLVVLYHTSMVNWAEAEADYLTLSVWYHLAVAFQQKWAIYVTAVSWVGEVCAFHCNIACTISNILPIYPLQNNTYTHIIQHTLASDLHLYTLLHSLCIFFLFLHLRIDLHIDLHETPTAWKPSICLQCCIA